MWVNRRQMAAETLVNPDRFCLSCKHSLRGIDSCRCPECGRDFDPTDPRTTGPRERRFSLQAIARAWRVLAGVAGVLACVCFFLALAGTDPIVTRVLAVLGSPVLVPLVVFVFGAALVKRLPISRRQRTAGIAAVVLFVSTLWTWWPFRITFAFLHKAEFTKIADQVQSGQTPALPRRVGAFKVINVRRGNGNIGLQVSGGAGGGTHFVRCTPDAERVWYNTNWEVYLGDGWYYVYED
jgi:hypothetical protein